MLILQWLFGIISKGRGIFSLIVLVALSLWMQRLEGPSTASFRKIAVSTVLYPVQVSVDHIRFRTRLKEDNRRLQQENARLALLNAQFQDAAIQNNRLRGLIGFRQGSQFDLIPANIVSREPTRLSGSWIIDVGQEQGVDEGMVGVTPDGLVGRIVRSEGGHSYLQTLTDPNLRASVIGMRSRHPGVLFSPDGIHVAIEYSPSADFRPGDTVVTWGAGGIFPKGIPVGVVAARIRNRESLLHQSLIKPGQNPLTAEEIFIVRRNPVLQAGLDMIPAESLSDSVQDLTKPSDSIQHPRAAAAPVPADTVLDETAPTRHADPLSSPLPRSGVRGAQPPAPPGSGGEPARRGQ